MKNLVIILFLYSGIINAQENKFTETISLPQARLLYWNVKNRIEYLSSQNYDSLWVFSRGGEFVSTSYNTGDFTPTGKKRGTISLEIIGKIGSQIDTLGRYGYLVIPLPDPKIYIENHDLSEDLNSLSDQTIFEDLHFRANYDYTLNSIIGIQDRHFYVSKWAVDVGDDEIIGSSSLDLDHLFAAITNAKKGDKIVFKSFDVLGPDESTRIIIVNSVYYKKGKKGEVINRKTYSLEPDEG